MLVGIPSSGVHSNGFSLVRKVIQHRRINIHTQCPWADAGVSVGEELLTPTRIYVKELLHALNTLHINIKGICHITGGGMTENIPRMFAKNSGLGAEVITSFWDTPEVFKYVQGNGFITIDEMRRVFNMGIGMVMVVSDSDVPSLISAIPDAKVIGTVIEGEGVKYI
jgi:phosphoribosylformylglycinamidine cyclo-ligase